jgi:hypothetical protein
MGERGAIKEVNGQSPGIERSEKEGVVGKAKGEAGRC